MTRRSSRSFAGRALAALALWLGFYVLGAAFAALLFALPWAQIRFEHTLSPSGMLAFVLGGFVLWAIFPRIERVLPPGRAVDPSAHPRLLALLEDVARRTGQARPTELYFLPEVNAFAALRSRGLFRRSVPMVAIGLPLFELLSAEELSAVIAHELGHHHAGDVRLGPWLHRTRRAIAAALGRLEGSSFWLHLPFVAYARLFLRIAMPVSRAQELHADAIAAEVCGAAATASSLRRIADVAALWDVYYRTEVHVPLAYGFAPPLLEGFRAFRDSATMPAELAAAVARAKERPPAPDDTHPTTSARIAALGERVPSLPPSPGCLSLLSDEAAAERSALSADLLPEAEARLERVPWGELPERVWIPLWKREMADRAGALSNARIHQLPAMVDALDTWSARLRRGVAVLSAEAQRRATLETLGTWLCLELHARGFAVDVRPGAEVVVARGGLCLEPFSVLRRMAAPPTAEAARAELRAVLERADADASPAPAVAEAR